MVELIQPAPLAAAAAVPLPALLSSEKRILSLTMIGEASGEGMVGMQAVGCIARNRWQHPRWWGHDIIGVCLAHSLHHTYQFDCWVPGSADRARILAMHDTDPLLLLVEELAGRIIDGTCEDITHSADSYVNLAIAQPSWAVPHKLTAKIGHHSFYRLEI